MSKKFKVWCEVCGFKDSFQSEEEALNIGSMHKKGFHKAGEKK